MVHILRQQQYSCWELSIRRNEAIVVVFVVEVIISYQPVDGENSSTHIDLSDNVCCANIFSISD